MSDGKSFLVPYYFLDSFLDFFIPYHPIIVSFYMCNFRKMCVK
jgi:hypothetical protein